MDIVASDHFTSMPTFKNTTTMPSKPQAQEESAGSGLFLSYRRNDSIEQTNKLDEALAREFPGLSVFIEPGDCGGPELRARDQAHVYGGRANQVVPQFVPEVGDSVAGSAALLSMHRAGFAAEIS